MRSLLLPSFPPELPFPFIFPFSSLRFFSFLFSFLSLPSSPLPSFPSSLLCQSFLFSLFLFPFPPHPQPLFLSCLSSSISQITAGSFRFATYQLPIATSWSNQEGGRGRGRRGRDTSRCLPCALLTTSLRQGRERLGWAQKSLVYLCCISTVECIEISPISPS